MLCCVIYKCNNFPERYFREWPPPKIYLTLFALPYILGVKEIVMPKIYERNPDTDEVREREMTEPEPYRNEMAEVLDVLKRIDLKLEFLASRDKNDYTSYQMWLDTRDE